MNIAVFCGSSLPRNKGIVEAAAVLGRRIAQEGHTLVYGGSNLGLMGVVSGAALEACSQRVTELVRVSTMAERKERILEMCDAFIALPGGIGTIDEVSEVMVMNQLQIVDGHRILDGTYRTKPMILLNIDGYYNPFLDQLRLVKEEGLMRSDAGLVSVKTVDDIFSILNQK